MKGLAVQVAAADLGPKIEEAKESIPEALGKLIRCCLSKEPAERPSAVEAVDQIAAVFGTARRGTDEEKCPFRGLFAFWEQHAELFFGRDAEIGSFLERLRTEVVLPVVGPSGAGKSSFVQAGVIPRLRERGPLHVIRLQPGASPFRALAARLCGQSTSRGRVRSALLTTPGMRTSAEEASERELALAEALLAEPKRLALHLLERAEEERSQVLLVVDQLEEVYTLVEDENERQRFVQAVFGAADDAEDPVRVVVTVRDDFFVRLTDGLRHEEVLNRVAVLHPPGRAALRDILLKPLEALGYAYDDPTLVDDMIAVVHGEASSLPLLQFAARMLWEARDARKRELRRSTYEAFGGVGGALASHADAVTAELGQSQLHLTRELFVRLITPERTRRVVAASALIEGLGEGAWQTLQRLLQARLLAVRRTHGESQVELAHEALISQWGQLARWLDEGREELVFLSEITQAAELWQKRGQRDDEVWVGGALAEAERTIERVGIKLPSAVRVFLDASQRVDGRRRRRRRNLIGAGITLLALIAVVSAGAALALSAKEREAQQLRRVAEAEKARAETEQHQAELQWAEAQTEGARAAYVRGDLLEARSKLRGALERRDSSAIRALWWRLSHEPLLWRHHAGGDFLIDVAFSPDGTSVAAAGDNGPIHLVDRRSGATGLLRGQGHHLYRLGFSADGRYLAYGDMSGSVGFWDLIRERRADLGTCDAPVWGFAFGGDDDSLAAACGNGEVRLWDVRTTTLVGTATLVESYGLRKLRFSPDRTRVLGGHGDGTLTVWKTASGEVERRWRGHDKPVQSLAFGAKGRLVASGGEDKSVRIWDWREGVLVTTLTGHTEVVSVLAFTPDPSRLVSASYDRTVRVWDLESGRQVRVLRGHESGVEALRVSADGNFLASTSTGGEFLVWDLRVVGTDRQASGHGSAVVALARSLDDTLVATGGDDRIVRLWDAARGAQIKALAGHVNTVYATAISHDGSLVASGGFDAGVRLWDVSSGAQLKTLLGHESGVFDLRFIGRGGLLASAGYDMTVRLWDIETGTQRRSLRHESPVTSLAVSPDRKLLAAVGMFPGIAVWDLSTGRRIRLPKQKAATAKALVWTTGVAFSPDGALLAAGSDDGVVRIVDLKAGGAQRQVLKAPGTRLVRLDYSPDGMRVGAGADDGDARIWELPSGTERLLRGHVGEVSHLVFFGDGERVATAGDDGTVRVWDVRRGRPLWRGPLLAESTLAVFSHRGWDSLAGSGNGREVLRETTAWRRAVETRAWLARETAGTLCLVNNEDGVELWDTKADRRLTTHAFPGVRAVLAIPGGCVVHCEGRAVLLSYPDVVKELATGVQAVAWERDRVLVARQAEALALDPVGEPEGAAVVRYETPPDVTALGLTQDHLVLGFRDGALELISRGAAASKQSFVFEATPGNPVTCVREGPMGTVVAGYTTGLIGLWNLADGKKLHEVKLHGPIRQLALREKHLYGLSELGDTVALDLRVFYLTRCELLREVWRDVPVRWESGFPLASPPPPEHPCVVTKTAAQR